MGKCACGEVDNFKYYDGCLGYEAIVCRKCGRYSDHNAEYKADDWSMEFVNLK